jgi:phosphoribosylaminoimidazolecarboxamide formyltransferase/IMP cyclohydrolase
MVRIHNRMQHGVRIKDQESIDTCNELDMTMIFTGKRHFLH